MTSHGQVKILDFGLAKLARLASEEVDSGLDLIGDGDAGGKPRERGSKPIVECPQYDRHSDGDGVHVA